MRRGTQLSVSNCPWNLCPQVLKGSPLTAVMTSKPPARVSLGLGENPLATLSSSILPGFQNFPETALYIFTWPLVCLSPPTPFREALLFKGALRVHVAALPVPHLSPQTQDTAASRSLSREPRTEGSRRRGLKTHSQTGSAHRDVRSHRTGDRLLAACEK